MSFVPLSVDDNPDPAPHGWSWRRLTELARLESGHTPSRRHPEWWGGDIPWLALPDIRALDGKVAVATSEYTNPDGILNSSARVLPAGTVALSRTASVGFVTILGRPMATSQDFVNWVCGPDLDGEFLAFLFRASRERIRSLASGAVHKTVYVPTVAAFRVCVPSLSEQKRIAVLLKRQVATVERARAAAKAQVEAARALDFSWVKALFTESSALGWPRRRLREITRLRSGGTPSRGRPESFEGRIPWVKTLDLNLGVVKTTQECISDQAFGEIRGELLPVGTVMVAMYGGAGTIGKSGILGIPAMTNQAICSILPNPELFVPEFLHAWLRFVRPDWMRYSAGNRRDPNISKDAVERMECPLPSLAEQQVIVNQLRAKTLVAERICSDVKAQKADIEALSTVLMRRAFDGGI